MSDPTIKVERGCPAAAAGVGCGCTGRCHELIDVVPAADYWRVVGERDEARRGSAASIPPRATWSRCFVCGDGKGPCPPGLDCTREQAPTA